MKHENETKRTQTQNNCKAGCFVARHILPFRNPFNKGNLHVVLSCFFFLKWAGLHTSIFNK